ncbi:hypothetical protein LZ554_003260 [Drepanopeziza brunnea f. sp. 'monogermtubi']|nr:hypothetical protein LZ554_003260 [Drepanopeziza brunnea f. sp. 'monogermtubi']
MDNHCPRRPAFGQYAALGTLYDARNECFLSGSLFDESLPPNSVSEHLIHKTTCQTVENDSYEDNFPVMGISEEFGASILAGLVLPHGAGVVLNEKTDSKRILRAFLHHRHITIKEKLDPRTPGIGNCRAASSLGSHDATHIVMEIEWGAQTTLMATCNSNPNKARFQGQVQALREAVETGRPIVQGSAAWLGPGDVDVEVMAYSDVLDEGILMSETQKLQEANEFLSIVPAYIKQENGGKGKPVFYTLFPIPLLNMMLQTETGANVTCQQPSPDTQTEFVRVFDMFDAYQRTWNYNQEFALAHKWCIPESQIEDIDSQKLKLDNAKSQLQTSRTGLEGNS